MPRLVFTLAFFLASALLGCGKPAPSPPTPSPSATNADTSKFTLTSPAFKDGEPIPVQYTADGKGVSPQLDWTGVPAGTKEFALIVDDPDAPRGTFTHWVIYAVPPSITSFPQDVPKTDTVPSLGGAKQGRNSADAIGYTPPSPPPSKVHHYIFHLYALDKSVPYSQNMTADNLRKAISSHVLATTELTGTYQR